MVSFLTYLPNRTKHKYTYIYIYEPLSLERVEFPPVASLLVLKWASAPGALKLSLEVHQPQICLGFWTSNYLSCLPSGGQPRGSKFEAFLASAGGTSPMASTKSLKALSFRRWSWGRQASLTEPQACHVFNSLCKRRTEKWPKWLWPIQWVPP